MSLKDLNIENIVTRDDKMNQEIFDTFKVIIDLIAEVKKSITQDISQVKETVDAQTLKILDTCDSMEEDMAAMKEEDKITPLRNQLLKEIDSIKGMIPDEVEIPDFPIDEIQSKIEFIKKDVSKLYESDSEIVSSFQDKLEKLEKEIDKLSIAIKNIRVQRTFFGGRSNSGATITGPATSIVASDGAGNGAGTANATVDSSGNIVNGKISSTTASTLAVDATSTINQTTTGGLLINFKGNSLFSSTEDTIHDASFPEGGGGVSGPDVDVHTYAGTLKVAINDTSPNPNGGGAGYYIPFYVLSCLTGDTLINTPDGKVRIDSISVGDKVMSVDPDTKLQFENEVTMVQTHENQKGYMIVNELLNITFNHRVLLNGQFQFMRNAKIGDYMLNEFGKKVWIFSIEEVAVDDITLYNLKLKYETKDYIANGLVVHNKCPFLYTFKDGHFTYENTFLYNIDSKAKETIQRRPLKHISNHFVVRELEPEVSYIKNLWLIAMTPRGEVKLNWLNRPQGEYIKTKQGDAFRVKFEDIPRGTTQIFIEAEGYYEYLE